MKTLIRINLPSILALLLFLPQQFAFAISQVQLDQVQIDIGKKQIKLSQLKGKVIYIDFWASWCIPCRKSFPWMNDMNKKYSHQGLKIIAINLDKSRALATKFLKKYPASFTIGYDPTGKLANKFNAKGMPSTYLIDRNGKIVSSHLGFKKKDSPKLEALIKAELFKK